MRLISVSVVLALLIVGLIAESFTLTVVGAIGFVILSGLRLIGTYESSRKFRDGRYAREDRDSRSLVESTARRIEGIILVAGLVATAASIVGEAAGYVAVPGMIIWIGGVAIWFIRGVIIREVTGIPLEMGYGGWYVARKRRRRRH
jgi:hypothetical protein